MDKSLSNTLHCYPDFPSIYGICSFDTWCVTSYNEVNEPGFSPPEFKTFGIKMSTIGMVNASFADVKILVS